MSCLSLLGLSRWCVIIRMWDGTSVWKRNLKIICCKNATLRHARNQSVNRSYWVICSTGSLWADWSCHFFSRLISHKYHRINLWKLFIECVDFGFCGLSSHECPQDLFLAQRRKEKVEWINESKGCDRAKSEMEIDFSASQFAYTKLANSSMKQNR